MGSRGGPKNPNKMAAILKGMHSKKLSLADIDQDEDSLNSRAITPDNNAAT